MPRDLFDRVQERLEHNKKAPARYKAEEEYLLSTKLICGYCGAMLCGESGTGRNGVHHYYYKCASIKKHSGDCHKKTVRKLDPKLPSHRKTLIDNFLNAVILFDDKLILSFNYREGTETITFADLNQADVPAFSAGSDMENVASQKSRESDFFLFVA